MAPFDLDCRDADYRRDPERPRPHTREQDEQQSAALRLVGADRAAALATLDHHQDTEKRPCPWQQ